MGYGDELVTGTLCGHQAGGPAHALNPGLVHDIVLQDIATECVTLVARQFDRHLDWSLASLVELDAACDDLLADGPLGDQRLDLWWRLIDKVLRAEPASTSPGAYPEGEGAGLEPAVSVTATAS